MPSYSDYLGIRAQLVADIKAAWSVNPVHIVTRQELPRLAPKQAGFGVVLMNNSPANWAEGTLQDVRIFWDFTLIGVFPLPADTNVVIVDEIYSRFAALCARLEANDLYGSSTENLGQPLAAWAIEDRYFEMTEQTYEVTVHFTGNSFQKWGT